MKSGDSMAMGLNYSYLGISGHTLFKGTKSTLKVELRLFKISLFHRLASRSVLLVFFIQWSTKPSEPIAFPLELKHYNLITYSWLSGGRVGNFLKISSFIG